MFALRHTQPTYSARSAKPALHTFSTFRRTCAPLLQSEIIAHLSGLRTYFSDRVLNVIAWLRAYRVCGFQQIFAVFVLH